LLKKKKKIFHHKKESKERSDPEIFEIKDVLHQGKIANDKTNKLSFAVRFLRWIC